MALTVKELIEQLSELDENLPVILQKDSEGNGYSPCEGSAGCFYVAETSYSGECYSEEDAPRGAILCAVLWPTN